MLNNTGRAPALRDFGVASVGFPQRKGAGPAVLHHCIWRSPDLYALAHLSQVFMFGNKCAHWDTHSWTKTMKHLELNIFKDHVFYNHIEKSNILLKKKIAHSIGVTQQWTVSQ